MQVAGHLQAAERDLSIKCDEPRQAHLQLKEHAENNINDHNVALARELEARQNEVSSWSHIVVCVCVLCLCRRHRVFLFLRKLISRFPGNGVVRIEISATHVHRLV